MSKLSTSSVKVLTWLYGASLLAQRAVSWAELPLILPDMTVSGVRGLIFQLKRKKLLSVEQIESTRFLSITSHGRDEITAHFPALLPTVDNWQGDWAILVFMQSPSFDPQFRFLRQFLLTHHLGQFSRGVYVYPSVLPGPVLQQLRFYPGSVAVVRASEWQFGDERSVIGSIFSLSDLLQSLSGLSREISQLPDIAMLQKGLIAPNTHSFCMAFDRLLSILEFDIGIHTRYFPQVEGSKELLLQLQKRVKL